MPSDKEIKPTDQVLVRKPIRTGTLVQQGEVTKISPDGTMATVHYPWQWKSETVPVSSLERTEDRFGVRRTVLNPLRRTLVGKNTR